jgi:hypothetical protein
MPRRSLARLYKDEFTGYSLAKFQQDLLAGLTVAAVALPLALAFGVASGATAAAGLVTAILAGFIMGAHGRAVSDQRTHGRDVCRVDRARATLRTRRHLGRGILFRRALAPHRHPAAWSLHRLHPLRRHQRIHLGHCAHHLHRSN